MQLNFSYKRQLQNPKFLLVYIIVIELHMYTISHVINYIPCNSCNLFDSTHAHRNLLSCNMLQMIIATQKSSYKASCKLPHFFIVYLLKMS
jgi:hypothetical protein